MLGVELLAFDPQNPRLPNSVDGTKAQDVLHWMLTDEGLTELIGSIAEQGYFPGEPVLVAPADESNPGPPYLVVEGNRRLAATLLLANPAAAPTRTQTVERLATDARYHPSELPAIIFDSRDEILDYLGYRHVTGVKEWDPLAKARYVEQLAERARERGEELTDQQLARRIGSRADYVQRLRKGLAVYDHITDRSFYGLKGVNEDSISFSVLTTALSYENIAEFVGLDDADSAPESLADDNLKDLTDWMFRRTPGGSTVLGESRHLGALAAVVKSPQARSALKTGVALADARLLTDEPLKAFRKAVEQATDKLTLARSMTHQVSAPTEADAKALADLTNMARELATLVRSKIDGVDPTL